MKNTFVKQDKKNIDCIIKIANYIYNNGDIGKYSLFHSDKVPNEIYSEMQFLRPIYFNLTSEFTQLISEHPLEEKYIRNIEFITKDKEIQAMYLLSHDVSMYIPCIDEIIDKVPQKRIEFLDATPEGLVKIDNNELLLKPQGISHNNKIVFYNQLLRLYYSSYFSPITRLLSDISLTTELELSVSIDIYRKPSIEMPPMVAEKAYYFGKPFNRELLDNKSHNGPLVHYRQEIDGTNASSMLWPIERVDVTFTQHGSNFKSVEIEEIVPLKENELLFSNRRGIISDKYRINRHIHFEYNQANKEVIHLDGSVKIYNNDKYLKRLEDNGNSLKILPYSREKLFLINGAFDFELLRKILNAFFYENELIPEIFNTKL